METGLYIARGGHTLIVTKVDTKNVDFIKTKAGELRLKKCSITQFQKEGYKLIDSPIAIAADKFLNHFGGISDAAKAALLQLKAKEHQMDVKTATTKELVGFYNEHTGKNIKKFADRKTAEQKVSELLKAVPVTKKEKTAPKSQVSVIEKQGNKILSKTEHRSVFKAFEHFKLPIAKHVKFRAELKKNSTGIFEHEGKKYEFAI